MMERKNLARKRKLRYFQIFHARRHIAYREDLPQVAQQIKIASVSVMDCFRELEEVHMNYFDQVL